MSESLLSQDSTQTIVEPAKMKASKKIFLTYVFFTLVILFTLMKLPEVRLTSVLQSYIQMALDPYGIYLSDQGREISFLRGFQYSLVKPSLELADQTRIELDSVQVAPKWSALLGGKMGASSVIKQGTSEIDLDAAIRGDQINLNLNLSQVDLGKMGLFSYLASMRGSGTISGTIKVDGALSNPASLEGIIDLKVKKLHLDEQNLMGFQLPNLNIADGTITLDIHAGKVVAKLVQIGGKPSDDISIGMTGDITLNRNVNSSILNLRAILGLSDGVKKSLALLDSILGSAKLADGRYAYKLTGTVASPMPIPDTAK